MSEHLDALRLRLSNERCRLSMAKSDQEAALRKVWITQIEKEIALEETSLPSKPVLSITDDDLIAELEGHY